MKDYENMSDFEISKEVFFKAGVDYQDCIATNSKGSSVHYGDGANWYEFNPCNNILDSWPLITDNNICIHNNKRSGGIYAMTFDDYGFVKYECYNDNPLRAAMVVFLKIKDSE